MRGGLRLKEKLIFLAFRVVFRQHGAMGKKIFMVEKLRAVRTMLHASLTLYANPGHISKVLSVN